MSAKKNICVTINSLSAGGAEKQCILLAAALKEHHNVTVIILSPEKLYPPRLVSLKDQNIQYKFLSKNRFKSFFQMIQYFRKNNIDFVFSFLPTDTVMSAVCGKLAGVPYIFGGIRSSFLPKSKFKLLKYLNNTILRYTISNNFSARETAIRLGFNSNVLVIPNGIEIRALSVRRSKKTISIISLGRLVAPKCYDIAIQTIEELKNIVGEKYDIKYTIVGQGELEEDIRAQIKSKALESFVSVITDATDIYGLLDASDIYLCTSSFEGISNALMEAMNCQLPIVATDVGDNSKLVLHDKSGFLAPVHDYKKLAENLSLLVRSDDLRKKMGAEGYKHLDENFSYEAFQQKYLHIISNVENLKIIDGRVKETSTVKRYKSAKTVNQ